jgi:hypothetical protein
MKKHSYIKNLASVVISVVILSIGCKNRSTGSTNTSDVLKDSIAPKAIIHGSDDQAKLDSIKAAKQKGK